MSSQHRQGIGMTSQRTRDRLVQRLRDKGIVDERVLAQIGSVPRHLFIDEALAHRAYEDVALPIGFSQTISQPFVVARMTELLLERSPQRVLEIGTGCGYQTAVLAALFDRVWTVERIAPLAARARDRCDPGLIRLHRTGACGAWPAADRTDAGPIPGRRCRGPDQAGRGL